MSPRPLLPRLVLVASALALASGCGAVEAVDAAVDEAIGSAEEAISGGQVDPGEPAVVGIFAKNLSGLCSGSLIAPNLVLTARHCVSEISSPNGQVDCASTTFGPPGPADDFLVTTRGVMSQHASDYRRAIEVVLLPVDNKLCGQDMALLVLESNVGADEASPLVPRVDAPVQKGETYDAIGFGATDEQGAGAGTRRRRDDLAVKCVGPQCPAAYVGKSEWTGQAGVCEGDSGGPAIDLQGRVVGVTSRGGLDCSSPIYGHVEAWADWLKGTAKHAAQVGQYAPPRWATGWPTDPAYSMPIGDGCKQPADCASDRCVDDGVAAYCTRLCNEQAPCPTGWSCGKDSAGQGVCFQSHEAADEISGSTMKDGSCSMRADPTKPIPWRTGALLAGLALLAPLRRRRRRAI